jgi:hypothetical protein
MNHIGDKVTRVAVVVRSFELGKNRSVETLREELSCHTRWGDFGPVLAGCGKSKMKAVAV